MVHHSNAKIRTGIKLNAKQKKENQEAQGKVEENNILRMSSASNVNGVNRNDKTKGIHETRKPTWKFLEKILILVVLSLTAYSPSVDQTNSNAEPNDLFLHAKAV